MEILRSVCFPSSLLVVILILIVSCEKSPIEKLEEQSIEYNYNSFIDEVKKGHILTVQLFVEAGINVNQPDVYEKTPLIIAIENRQPEMATFLLDHGALFWMKDGEGTPPIIYAVHAGLPDVIRKLLELGAFVDQVDSKFDLTPLIYSIGNRQSEIREILIEAGADIEFKNRDGGRPIHTAAAFNNLEAVRRLLDLGADPNVQIVNGYTPLHLAANDSSIAVLQELLDRGADPTKRTDQGLLPADVAFRRSQQQAHNLLRIKN